MRSFLISLLVFILLMCSCRTKKEASNVATYERNVATYGRNVVTSLKDTSRVLRMVIDKSKMRFIETIIVREYDKDTGIVTKETETKRETIQDSDKVATEEEKKEVETHLQDSLNHIADVSKMVESETETVTENKGLASVWSKFGEVIGIGTLIIVAYLCWKLKSRVN